MQHSLVNSGCSTLRRNGYATYTVCTTSDGRSGCATLAVCTVMAWQFRLCNAETQWMQGRRSPQCDATAELHDPWRQSSPDPSPVVVKRTLCRHNSIVFPRQLVPDEKVTKHKIRPTHESSFGTTTVKDMPTALDQTDLPRTAPFPPCSAKVRPSYFIFDFHSFSLIGYVGD